MAIGHAPFFKCPAIFHTCKPEGPLSKNFAASLQAVRSHSNSDWMVSMPINEQRRILTFPLRLGFSLKETANFLALKDGVSLNYFISVAVAEKVSRIEHQSLVEHDLLAPRHKGALPLADGVRKLSSHH
jgi:hypothetical protein